MQLVDFYEGQFFRNYEIRQCLSDLIINEINLTIVK